MLIYAIVYVAPLLVRFGLSDDLDVGRIVLSLLPLVVTLPSTFLPHVLSNDQTEHVVRHAIYAVAFSVAVGVCIRWDVVASRYDQEAWASNLIVFAAVGAITLWWFVASHVLENAFGVLFTHQGDVTVLPLTLIAISTFVYDVPDEAFQFFRSVLFYVPVVVAWATLHFIAFNDFATSKTTTHSVRGFTFLATSSLVVSSAHLALIELRARPVSFVFLPVVASVLSQVTSRPTLPPVMRPGRVVGMLTVETVLILALDRVLRLKFDTSRTLVVHLVLGALVVGVVPTLCGRRWVVPGTLYATLLSVSYIEADGRVVRATAFDALAIAAHFVLAFQGTQFVSPAVEDQPSPPTEHVEREDDTPQTTPSSFCTVTSVLRQLESLSIPSSRRYDHESVLDLMRRQRDSCPEEFAGVWWCKGTSFPMQLLTVHEHEWTRRDDDVWTTTFSLRGGARSATVAGLLNMLGQALCATRVEWRRGDKWVRTPGWFLPWFRLFPATYWIYRLREDEMVRVVFDRGGRVVWQYKMLRILKGTTRTRFYDDFLSAYGGRRFLLS